MAKVWSFPGLFELTVADTDALEKGQKPCDLPPEITVKLEKEVLAPYEAGLLADHLIRAMHEVTYHRFMRSRAT